MIDYRSDFIQKCYRPFFIADGKVFNAIVRGICFGKNIRKRKKGFAEFTNKYLCCSKPYFTSDEIKADRDEYSFYISGSDQVWSPISAGFDPVYFLPFARDEQKLSYAASIGSTELNTDIKKELFSRLNGFQVLSVREESAKKLLMDADTNREIYVHPDPTLLIPREQWLKIASDPVVKEKYVLVFNVEKPIHDITYAKKLATEKNMKVVYPPLMEKPMNQKPSLHQMEHYQKFYENGEYVRAVESTTEQNYNMIDGCANNLPKPRIINGRESVLDKLRIRQMAREKQKSSQEQSADMERNRK